MASTEAQVPVSERRATKRLQFMLFPYTYYTGVVEIIPKSGPKKSSELFSFYPFFGII